MLRKFLPLFVLGVLGMILMIAFLVRQALKEEANASVVEVQEELSFQESIRRKLNELVLPELNLKNSTVEEAVEFLRLRSLELGEEEDRVNRGISFVVRGSKIADDDDGADPLDGGLEYANDPKVTLSEKNIGIADALDLISREAGLKWRVGEYAIEIQPKEKNWPQQRSVVVDPDDPFSGAADQDPEDDPFGQE